MKIFIDSDGFFWPDDINPEYMRVQRELISFDNEQQSLDNLFEQYYLGFRSALFICEDTVENESEAREALRIYREGCIQSAIRYMKNHIESRPPLPVDFMWIVREAVTGELKKEFPEVDNIKLQLSMKPRLSARTFGKNTIIFPALTRSVLIHCNLVIINSVLRAIDEDGELVKDIDRKQIARYIFPYLLYCHDDFSVRNLPIISAYSQAAIETAFQFTNLQLIFIFAHEYAHVLLNHFDDSNKENIEDEADSFALKVVLAYVEKTDSYSKLDIFASIRWLFKFQLIEESIGALIREKPLDFSTSNLEGRRGNFQRELLKTHGFDGSSLLESIGFCMIVELQNILYECGSKLVNYVMDVFHESKRTGGVEPWWEKITQN